MRIAITITQPLKYKLVTHIVNKKNTFLNKTMFKNVYKCDIFNYNNDKIVKRMIKLNNSLKK